MRRLSTWLIVALAGGALVAGCGSSGSSTVTSTQTTPAAASTTTGSTSTSSTPSSSASSSSGSKSTATSPTEAVKPPASTNPVGVPNSPGGAKAVASCKQAIHNVSAMSPAVKKKLEGICDKASGGSKAELEKVAHEECVAIVSATPLPAGVSKAKALAICSTPQGAT